MNRIEIFNINQWDIQINAHKDVYLQPDFLRILENRYEGEIMIFVLFFNDKIRNIIGGLSYKKKFYYPHHFLFSPYFQSTELSENECNNGIKLLLKEIKKKHNQISLRLPICIKDIRPFIWEDFSYILKYTYLKKIKDREFHPNIKRILKKQNFQYSFKIENKIEIVKNFLINDLNQYNFSNSKELLNYLQNLSDLNLIIITSAYRGEILKACNLIFLNSGKKEAYFFLISKVGKDDYKQQLPTLMYEFSFQKLEEIGIEYADLFGANIENVSNFKSKLFPELKEFYEVEYSKIRTDFVRFLAVIKSIVKRIYYLKR